MTTTRTTQRFNHKLLITLAGTAIMGLSTATHAQTCSPVEAVKLLASDGAANDNFGYAVAISGDTAVIGARLDDDNGGGSGSVYVYTFDGSVWTQQAKLLASDGLGDDHFGETVAIDGDTIVVGASGSSAMGNDSGSAYVFARSGTIWTQQAKLIASDGAFADTFGNAVSVSGDIALVGSWQDDDMGSRSGSAYTFSRNGGVWTQQQKLIAADGSGNDYFGIAVSISGDTAVIGAYKDDDNAAGSGSVYVFQSTAGVWSQQTKLNAADAGAFDEFGYSVSIDGDAVIVGAIRDDDLGTNSGSAYVFARSGTVWTQEAKLLPTDGVGTDIFGYSVSISGDVAAVGAYWNDDNGAESGSAYVYSRSGGAWDEQAKLLPADGANGDLFGHSVSVSGDTAFVGAIQNDDLGSNSGSAYVFDLMCQAACPVDMNGDGTINFVDVSAFVSAFGNNDLSADFNGDGTINFVDVSAFVAAFGTGCP